MDYTYDIYAEWPLEKEEFDKEVARVQALYESQSSDYVTVQKGDYTCFFLYDGNPPFEEVTDSYTYFIFAFDEQNLIVRYIMCDSLENGVDQPYYLSLDWWFLARFHLCVKVSLSGGWFHFKWNLLKPYETVSIL